jgi:hypothetical protein
MKLGPDHVSSGISGKEVDTPSDQLLGSRPSRGNGASSGSILEPDRNPINPSMNYTFKIFRDWRGTYRWMLTDQTGRRLLASRFGFAALAGAFRDIEVEQADTGHYASAAIRDETGR